MKEITHLLALPVSLITLISSLPCIASEPWPHNLAPHERYFPEHEPHIKRDLEIQQRLALAPATGMRKMSGDEGEKFFLDYWQFDDSSPPQSNDRKDLLGTIRACPDAITYENSTLCGLLPPLLPHSDKQPLSYISRILGRDISMRDFQCPSDTANCASIGESDACCAIGETCISVQDTGSGPVGCCPSGKTCGGEVAACNTAAGYSSCPGSANGGCCIPGYSCQGVGCIYVGSSTTTTTLPVTTVTTGVSTNRPFSSTVTSVSTASSPASVQTITTTIISTPPASTGVTTVTQIIIITPSESTSPTSTTLSPTSTSASGQGVLTCTQGYHSCPSSLGGGCCPTNRSCASANLCLATSTSTTIVSTSPSATTTTQNPTATAVPPNRPTSGSGTTVTEGASSSSSTVVYSGCPTGFYMCSAYHLGGCCRVGRNCDTTSCPSDASTAVVVTSGLTIVAGGTAASSVDVVTLTSTTTPGATVTSGAASSAAGGGSCAAGWFGCAASDGGGCCPSGFVCGASCTATVSGQSNVGKEAPSEGFRTGVTWAMIVVACASSILMLSL